MKAAIIKDNVVVNITKVADAEFAESQGWVVSDTARIGDLYDANTGEFTTPEPAPEPIPKSITRRQAKQQLAIDNLLSQVQPNIDAITNDTERTMVQIYWDDATTFERDNKELIALTEALGLTNEQLDTMFKEASKL